MVWHGMTKQPAGTSPRSNEVSTRKQSNLLAMNCEVSGRTEHRCPHGNGDARRQRSMPRKPHIRRGVGDHFKPRTSRFPELRPHRDRHSTREVPAHYQNPPPSLLTRPAKMLTFVVTWVRGV